MKRTIAKLLIPAIAPFLVLACDSKGTSVEDVQDDPAEHVGETVSLLGEVVDVHAPGVFTIDGEGSWWDDDILVVVPPAQRTTVFEEDNELRVTGEVTILTVAEIERDFEIDLSPEIEVEYASEPIVIASNVAMLEKD